MFWYNLCHKFATDSHNGIVRILLRQRLDEVEDRLRDWEEHGWESAAPSTFLQHVLEGLYHILRYDAGTLGEVGHQRLLYLRVLGRVFLDVEPTDDRGDIDVHVRAGSDDLLWDTCNTHLNRNDLHFYDINTAKYWSIHLHFYRYEIFYDINSQLIVTSSIINVFRNSRLPLHLCNKI